MSAAVLDGFAVPARDLPRPLVPVSDELRDGLCEHLMAIVLGRLPEEIAAYVEEGFPAAVTELLALPGAREQFRDYVDGLLSCVQAPG